MVLALLWWLFMERIHPSFCALRAGAMRVGILGIEGSKRGNAATKPRPPFQHVGGGGRLPAPGAFNILQSAATNMHKNINDYDFMSDS